MIFYFQNSSIAKDVCYDEDLGFDIRSSCADFKRSFFKLVNGNNCDIIVQWKFNIG
jgi:hypothetical protein